MLKTVIERGQGQPLTARPAPAQGAGTQAERYHRGAGPVIGKGARCLVFSPLIFWPWFAGAIVLVIGLGLIAVRREWSAAQGLDKLLVFGRVCYAAPLAAFGAEHLSGPQLIVRVVPPWMPAREFWVYFVGVALIVAALSIVLGKHVRWAGTLLGIMFFLFVVLMHLPNAAKLGTRIMWAITLRDLAFGGGGLALAATEFQGLDARRSGWLALVARFFIAIPALVFGVEHFLHPEFVPGVPLAKLTPDWIPFPPFWGYLTGAVLLVAGLALLLDRRPRTAATVLGAEIVFVVLFLYLPMLVAAEPKALMECVNYIFDTLLFGGTVLLLATAMPRESPARRA